MRVDTTIAFADPALADMLSDLVRDGAQRIIKQAVQAELDAFLQAHTNRDDDGRRAVVRNGYQPERHVLTGVGPVSVALPKTRDRAGRGRRFSSALLPPYLKKTRRLEAVLPRLYLKGLSASTISRLKVGWENEYERFRERDWRGHEMVYLWADGIVRHEALCDRAG